MDRTYKILSILHRPSREERLDGRYPLRIGRVCRIGQIEVGKAMFLDYLYDADGTPYNGTLRTSKVLKFTKEENHLLVETRNSIYVLEVME